MMNLEKNILVNKIILRINNLKNQFQNSLQVNLFLALS